MSTTFVLVPGTWVGGWAWHAVVRDLEENGHRVLAPTMPGLSPGDDLRAISLADASDHLVAGIERLGLSDVVLVAHDWSGYPVTAAAHRLTGRIARLVYWSAFVPLAGESMLETIPEDDREALTGAGKEAGGESVLVPRERWEARFVQTAPQAVKELTYGLLRPMPWAYLSESPTAADAAIPDVPLTYVASSADLSLPEGDEWWAAKYAPRLGVEPVAFDACHSAYFTTPDEVAAMLMKAARS